MKTSQLIPVKYFIEFESQILYVTVTINITVDEDFTIDPCEILH